MLHSYSIFHDTCVNDGSWWGQIVCIIHVCGCLDRIGDVIYQSMYELSVSRKLHFLGHWVILFSNIFVQYV